MLSCSAAALAASCFTKASGLCKAYQCDRLCCICVQALGERIRPVLTVNKLDRCFLELMLDGEEAYNGFRRVIESANVILATYADDLLGDTQVGPERGTVSFSAGLHGWAFTLTSFAKIYAKRFGVEVSRRCLIISKSVWQHEAWAQIHTASSACITLLLA